MQIIVYGPHTNILVSRLIKQFCFKDSVFSFRATTYALCTSNTVGLPRACTVKPRRPPFVVHCITSEKFGLDFLVQLRYFSFVLFVTAVRHNY